MISIWVRVELEVIIMKKYSPLLRTGTSPSEPIKYHNQDTPFWGCSYPSAGDTVRVFKVPMTGEEVIQVSVVNVHIKSQGIECLFSYPVDLWCLGE